MRILQEQISVQLGFNHTSRSGESPYSFQSIIPKQLVNRPYRRTNQAAKYRRQHSDEKLNTANRKSVAHTHV